jgi:hypothetical protein
MNGCGTCGAVLVLTVDVCGEQMCESCVEIELTGTMRTVALATFALLPTTDMGVWVTNGNDN